MALKLSSQAVVSATVLALVAVENKKDLRASVRFSVCVCVCVSVCVGSFCLEPNNGPQLRPGWAHPLYRGHALQFNVCCVA